MKKLIPLVLLAFAAAACNPPAEAPQPEAPPPSGAAAPVQGAAAQAAAALAKVGQPAPDFSLPDLDGKTVNLADFKGKTVVLEWYNPDCPFVQMSHRKAGLKDSPAQHIGKGVVWLAINSGAPGKQGHGKSRNEQSKADFGMTYPILLDESGAVGRLYGARRTPEMYVIDPKGILVYAGAIDSSKGGEPEPGEAVTHYVDVALAALAAGTPIQKTETEAFGCSVKY